MNADLQKLLEQAVTAWKNKRDAWSNHSDYESYSGQLLRALDVIIYIIYKKALSGDPLTALELRDFVEDLPKTILTEQRMIVFTKQRIEKLTLLEHFDGLNKLTKSFPADTSFTQTFASIQKHQAEKEEDALAYTATLNLAVIEEKQIHAVPLYPFLVTDELSKECLEFLIKWINQLLDFSWETLFKDTNWFIKQGVSIAINKRVIPHLEKRLESNQSIVLTDEGLKTKLEQECKEINEIIQLIKEIMADKSGKKFAGYIRTKLEDEKAHYELTVANFKSRQTFMKSFQANVAALRQLTASTGAKDELSRFSQDLNKHLTRTLAIIDSLDTLRDKLDNVFANISLNNTLKDILENLKSLLQIELATLTDFKQIQQILLTTQNILAFKKKSPQFADDTQHVAEKIFDLFIENIEKQMRTLDDQITKKEQNYFDLLKKFQNFLEIEQNKQKSPNTSGHIESEFSNIDDKVQLIMGERRVLIRRRYALQMQLSDLHSSLIKDQDPSEIGQRFHVKLKSLADSTRETKEVAPANTNQILSGLGGAGHGAATTGDNPSYTVTRSNAGSRSVDSSQQGPHTPTTGANPPPIPPSSSPSPGSK